MIAIEVTAFIDVYRDFAVSNTPLFFLRKLKEAAAPVEFAKIYTGEELLDALRKSLRAEIETRTDYVTPYVFLMALARKPDIQYLKEVKELDGQERFDWFNYLWRVLMETYSPLMITSFEAPKIGRYSTVVQNASSTFRDFELIGARPCE